MPTYSKFIFILLFSFLALVIFNNVFPKNINIPFLTTPCSSPKTFEIVSINKNFNLSTTTAVAQANLVAKAWNKAFGKEVLKYENGGEIKISFIYDERQREAINKKILSEKIRVKEEELKKDNQSIAALKIDFDNKNKIFEIEKNTYENNLNTYNSKVEKINASGGATRAQAEALDQEKASLDVQKNSLQNMVNQLNSLQVQINQNIDTHNSQVDNVNAVVNSYNANSLGEFEKGLYSSFGTIDIYEYEDLDSLKRVMAHELGHALGMDHVAQKKSIMHYIDDSSGFNITKADVIELEKVCKKDML